MARKLDHILIVDVKASCRQGSEIVEVGLRLLKWRL